MPAGGSLFRLKLCGAAWILPLVLFGAAACGPEDAASPEDTGTSPAALELRINAAAALTERLQGIRAVKRLQHAYGHYSEVGLWNDFADLFSDTAIGHYTQGDLGREQIRKLFIEEVGQGIVGLAEGRIYPHIALSPVVTLAPDGQSAKARWRIVAMLGGYGRSAIWARGVYENVYVKERGTWKVQEITFSNQVSQRYGDSLRPTVEGPLDAPTVAFHYAPADVGAPLTPPASAATTTLERSSFAVLAKRMSELEAEVRQLTAEDAVLNLQNAYGYYVDRKLWDDVADLFADDGTLEIGQGGVYVGKASIRRALDQFGHAGLDRGEVNDYIEMQPVVTIAPDGATAKVRGVYLGMTGRAGVGAQWREGIYETEYARDGGVWRIEALHDYPRLVTDYDKGWALDAKPVNGPSAAFPPDRPPTSAYESYPKFVIPPLHFRHPVTGRRPQYPASHVGGDPSVATEAPQPAMPAATMQELERSVAQVERDLRAVAATEAAENLLNAFGYYADEHMWDEAAELFATNGWADPTGQGAYVGREHVRRALHALFGGRREGVFELNQIAQPVVHAFIDGSAATRIRARLARIDAAQSGDGAYIAGLYEASVIEEKGAERIAALDFVPTWAARASRGWARVADGEAGALVAPSSGAPPPDRPSRGAALRFPTIDDVPFHYANPVSGRTPARGSF